MSTELKDGTVVDDPRLDRVHSGHTKHLDRYPLTLDTLPEEPRGMAIGINWYSNFDNPQPFSIGRAKRYMAIGQGNLGRVRGGHATCLINWNARDPNGWWTYYDQGVEGRCVEFATLRMLSLHNRRRYDITSRWHYYEAQRRDAWEGGSYPGARPVYEGTSVDAGMQVVHQLGAIRARRLGAGITLEKAATLVSPDEGIAAYRWAHTWDMVRTAMDVPPWLPGVPMLNSWGRSYPHMVLLLDEAGERVLREDGEFALITDR